MNNDIKAQRLAELLGIEVPENFKAPVANEVAYENETRSREAEAVLAYVDDSRKFIQRECKNCGGTFAVNRASVAYCNDNCRIRALEKIGITWDPSKSPAERWEFKEPLTVPPLILEHLQEVADQVVAQRELLEQTPVIQHAVENVPQVVLVDRSDLEGLLADLGID